MNDLENILNEQQLEGVLCTEGPVLILAGAGSGKTRVLTHRVAYLIQNNHVPAYNILAITFTNKAAGEMRHRIADLCGAQADMVWAATFHSTCARILRRFADRLGYDNRFAIYDTEDSKAVMKEVIRRRNLDPKKFKERYFLNRISQAKNELVTPEEYASFSAGNPEGMLIAQIYRSYQDRLRDNNAMDFDDLLMKTVELFEHDRDVLNTFQERFRYIMVDEYQDTNSAQFKLISLLADKYKNLCVVGDDDQSIYRFRGANIRNILDFEQHFPDARVIRLERNYRSIQKILDVANSVICHNAGRKEKSLWTDNKSGDKVAFRQFDSAREEAMFIANDVASCIRNNRFTYRECAVLYRTNAQSRILEEQFVRKNIPYRIVGGVNFYGRREIKDILAYLKIMNNPKDDLSVKRIINVPKRGIGATTINRVSDYAAEYDLSFYEALFELDDIPQISRAKSKLSDFRSFIEELKAKSEAMSVSSIIKEVIESTDYANELRLEQTDEAKARLENIDELINKAVTFDNEYISDSDESGRRALSAFLEEVALVADIDRLSEDEEYVVLMTLHSAKGLEFDNVYMSGLEDGLFPSFLSLVADDPEEEIEEERRLFYVGVTRAKRRLTITAAKSRMVQGETRYSAISRFIKEIPKDMLEGTAYDERRSGSLLEERSSGSMAFSSRNSAQSKNRTRQLKRRDMDLESSLAPTRKIEKKPLDYSVGDRVTHQKFGEGEVISVTDGGRDFEVAVRFNEGKVRKMFASFANLTKV